MSKLHSLHSDNTPRNTKDQGVCRSRGWTFTLNNYTEENVTHLHSLFENNLKDKIIFQSETGKEGTKHLQGGIYFKEAKSFLSVKKILPKAHIEPCKNWLATVQYCSKEDTYNGDDRFSNFKKDFIENNTERKRSDDGRPPRVEMIRMILKNMQEMDDEILLKAFINGDYDSSGDDTELDEPISDNEDD